LEIYEITNDLFDESRARESDGASIRLQMALY
jgi:hypothetical protein